MTRNVKPANPEACTNLGYPECEFDTTFAGQGGQPSTICRRCGAVEDSAYPPNWRL